MDFTKFLGVNFSSFLWTICRKILSMPIIGKKKKSRSLWQLLTVVNYWKFTFQTRIIYGKAILTFLFELQRGRRRTIVLVINFWRGLHKLTQPINLLVVFWCMAYREQTQQFIKFVIALCYCVVMVYKLTYKPFTWHVLILHLTYTYRCTKYNHFLRLLIISMQSRSRSINSLRLHIICLFMDWNNNSITTVFPVHEIFKISQFLTRITVISNIMMLI